jgi:hypothetical protein
VSDWNDVATKADLRKALRDMILYYLFAIAVCVGVLLAVILGY